MLAIVAVVAFAFLLLVFFFFGVVIRNINLRRKKEIETFNAVLQAQERERKRIAVDMHDEIGPLLSAVKLQIGAFGLIEDKTQLRRAIDETSREFDNAIREVRNAIANLAPTGLSRNGLLPTIRQFGNTIESKGNINFRISADELPGKMNEAAEINIYRIIQEMITNSLKHSNCTQIDVSLKLQNNLFLIAYRDNGTPKNNTTNPIAGMGIENIRSRTVFLGGKIKSAVDFSNGADYLLSFHQKNIFG